MAEIYIPVIFRKIMKIEDVLDLTERYSTTGGLDRDGPRCPSIYQEEITPLVDKLAGKNVPIIGGLSEMEIEYMSGNQERKAVIPLNSRLEGCSFKINKYLLRGDYNLILSLEDFFESHGEEGVAGGTVYNRKGIICQMSMEATANEAPIIERAKEIIQNFYKVGEELPLFKGLK